ncbi:polyamine aminopropyltransferase [Comamonas flocculans]|uniref:Polyamine aminopropyltransferase n=1 Tax=Comamonas flocculans TaxID=2597701 RepID=A0A5B8RRZ6_9BURK|nr:polyamine aminopropyltransferase [Comamonas flocculans]QEA11833.1 polyamine aminopropyltransferase [Comamonas flocculans]
MTGAAAGARQAVAERLNAHFGFYLTHCELLAQSRSEWQHIEIFEHPQFGRVMRIDGCFMTSERDEFFYHEPMVHLPAIAHPGVRHALVVGGGDGGAAEELLKLPGIEQVTLCELDDEVVRMAREWLPSIHRGALDDRRLRLQLGDARIFMQATEERFDQIVLDLTDPFGPAVELYTVQFYQTCQRILQPGGVISLHLGSPIHLQESLQRIHASLKAVFPIVRPYLQYVPLYGTLWCMAMASDTSDPAALTPAQVDARLRVRGIGRLQLYNGQTHQALLAQPNFLAELLRQRAAPLHSGQQLGDVHDPADLPPITIIEG